MNKLPTLDARRVNELLYRPVESTDLVLCSSLGNKDTPLLSESRNLINSNCVVPAGSYWRCWQETAAKGLSQPTAACYREPASGTRGGRQATGRRLPPGAASYSWWRLVRAAFGGPTPEAPHYYHTALTPYYNSTFPRDNVTVSLEHFKNNFYIILINETFLNYEMQDVDKVCTLTIACAW